MYNLEKIPATPSGHFLHNYFYKKYTLERKFQFPSFSILIGEKNAGAL